MKSPSSKIINSLWTISDVAEFCQVKESVVKYWVYNADLPFIKLGKHVRFEAEDVKVWIEGRKCERVDNVLRLLDKEKLLDVI